MFASVTTAWPWASPGDGIVLALRHRWNERHPPLIGGTVETLS